MAKAVDVGTGSTIAFGTTAYEADIHLEDLSFEGFERAVIDITTMATTGSREFMVGDLYTPPVLTITVQWNPDEPAPYDQAAETVTVTFPIPSGSMSGATMAGSAAITSVSHAIPLEDKMTATFTITFLNDITFGDSA